MADSRKALDAETTKSSASRDRWPAPQASTDPSQHIGASEQKAPQLAEVLGLEPGMTTADIGTGVGAMAMVLGRLVGSGRIHATDITQRSLIDT